MKLRLYPSVCLTLPCAPITFPLSPSFFLTIQAMRLHCKEARGYALAAPQVGIMESFFVMAPGHFQDKGEVPEVFFNPKIAYTEGTYKMEESCLSLPGIYAPLSRPNKVTIAYQDAKGDDKFFTADKVLGRVVQHEVDHLSGILFHNLLLQPHKARVLQEIKQRFP